LKENLYTVPQNKKVRIIIDTDAYAEADDHFAIVHLMVFRGEERALPDEKTAGNSEGAKFIVEEALKQDDRPLFILNMGAITNLASAYLMNNQIADKLLAVWVGGGPYPTGHMDFNSGNDLNAVNELECGLDLDFLPFAKNLSKAGKTMLIRSGEGWSLGDNPAVGVLISPQTKFAEERRAQRMNADGSYGEYISENRTIKVYHSINSRVILEDMFAKIRYHFGD
jgi:hypothetical protein